MANLQDIRSNNEEINKKIKQIVEIYKSQGKTAFNEDGKLDENVKKILQSEMKKCVAIYLAEFPKFECKDIEKLIVEPTYKNEADCRGGPNGIKVDIGIQPFIDGNKPNQLRGAGIEYSRDSNATVYIEESTRQNLKKSIESKSLLKVDSTRDQFDYFAELLADGKIDLDWMLDVLPHEAMHIFVPGEGVFVEGTTEELSRETADKYGLRLTPTSHQRETQIVKKIEKIVGRDVISSIALTNEQKDKIEEIKQNYDPVIKELKEQRKFLKKDNSSTEEIDKRISELKLQKKQELEPIYAPRYEKLKEEIDSKMGQGTFDKLKSSFDRQYLEVLDNKNNFQAYREDYYSDEIAFLDEWIAEHPEQLVNNDEQTQSYDEAKLDLVMKYQIQEIVDLDDIIKRLQTQMKSIESDNKGKIDGKSGFDDCMQDSSVRISTEQEATKVVKEAVIGKEKVLDENEQQK